MAYTSIYKDIVFIEGDNPKAINRHKIKTNLTGIGAQFKNLNNVKDQLVMQAKFKKCNCVLDFKYGQKTSWLSIDDVKFYGIGTCAELPLEEYKLLIEKCSK